jgi:hypothetical protein
MVTERRTLITGEDPVHVADVGVAAAADGIGEAWHGRERQARTGLCSTADGTGAPVQVGDAGGGESRRGMDVILPSPMRVGARMWGRGVVGKMHCGAWSGRRG